MYDKIRKILNNELVGKTYTSWIDLDNDMIDYGFASEENADWDQLISDESIAYALKEDIENEDYIIINFTVIDSNSPYKFTITSVE
ncbi:MAG: hypothetical protein ACLRVU_09810 [Beduini sp.]|uniref:hypothetical protein n=1 Tax=Beduini sp. TaxID=1922300 RepID=UPI00399F44ED